MNREIFKSEMPTKIKPLKILKSDGEHRAIFEKITPKDTINILTKLGGARTVLLSPY